MNLQALEARTPFPGKNSNYCYEIIVELDGLNFLGSVLAVT